ncbi:MAG: FAD-dependent monooxygenase [Piscinibacter sp.]|nr:FAD-dependent monooxygenase [Piscinibacter sp.]
MPRSSNASLAVIGAGPVGLALALRAAQALPHATVALFDARSIDKDTSTDPRVLALSIGSVQLLRRLGSWPSQAAEPILEVRVSQQQAAAPWSYGARREPELRILASEEGVPLLGAVLGYGTLVATLQSRWREVVGAEPKRLQARFGQPVTGLKQVPDGVVVEAGTVERFDLAIVAEGGVFGEQSRKGITHDYRQAAWVGTVDWSTPAGKGVAIERFSRHGPLALLPLPERRSALVWCVDGADDPIPGLADDQRLALLRHLLPAGLDGLVGISPLKRFGLGLNAERTLTHGRMVRIGNAAQTLHPVAGQGLNLGLRDAWALVRALRSEGEVAAALQQLEWQRAPDRWSMIAATDFLARSFTWDWPGLDTARGLGLAALQAFPPARSALARQMMFGWR